VVEETGVQGENELPVASHCHHEITEILLKVALNTINQTHVSFADFHTCKKCSNTTMKCHIIEMNDNINMDKTIAGLMNALSNN
jgi:hypothetical protein